MGSWRFQLEGLLSNKLIALSTGNQLGLLRERRYKFLQMAFSFINLKSTGKNAQKAVQTLKEEELKKGSRRERRRKKVSCFHLSHFVFCLF